MPLNVAIVQGNITRDLALEYLGSGTPCLGFTVAHNVKYKDVEKTYWISCKAFGKTAEFIERNFSKGSSIIVKGELCQDTWDDKNGGGKREKTQIRVESAEFCGAKNSNNNQQCQQLEHNQAKSNGYAPEHKPPILEQNEPVSIEDDDDIPF